VLETRERDSECEIVIERGEREIERERRER